MVLQKHSNQKREIIASLMKLPDTQPVSPEQAQSHRVETAEQAKALGLVLVEEPTAEVSGSRSGLRRRVHPMG